MQPINRTTAIIERSGRRKRLEISVKRRYIRDWNTREWREIQRTPEDTTVYYGYKFEILQHDLHLAFAPSDRRLPFLRITDPISGGVWVLWFVGWDDFTPANPIIPQLIDRGEGYVEWRLDETTRFRIEILGHLIRKMIILERRPVWNRLRFRIGRANALLLDGASVGTPQKRLLAFRQNASFSDNPIFWFTEPRAWDSAQDTPNTIKPQYDLIPITGALWEMSISLDADWLDNATYPVYIDPTIILQPDATEGKDTFIANNSADTPQDTKNISITENFYNIKMRGLIKFDFSVITSGSIINSATLELYLKSGGSVVPGIRKSLQSWIEAEATWNSPYIGGSWSIPGGEEGVDYSTIYINPYNTGTIWQWEIRDFVQEQINSNNFGYFLIQSNTIFNNLTEFYDSDYIDSTKHPKLTVDYTEGGIFIPAKLGSIAGKGSISPLASA